MNEAIVKVNESQRSESVVINSMSDVRGHDLSTRESFINIFFSTS